MSYDFFRYNFKNVVDDNSYEFAHSLKRNLFTKRFFLFDPVPTYFVKMKVKLNYSNSLRVKSKIKAKLKFKSKIKAKMKAIFRFKTIFYF